MFYYWDGRLELDRRRVRLLKNTAAIVIALVLAIAVASLMGLV